MRVLMNHVNLAIRMHNDRIDREFIKQFSLKDIINCCDRIEKNEIIREKYENNKLIQEELIRDEKFIDYLKILPEKELDITRLEKLLEKVRENNEKITDYSIKDIINVLSNNDLLCDSYYDYLKYFSNESIFYQKIITNNLNYFHGQDYINISDLTENERELFKLNYLDNSNLIPKNHLKETYEFLSNNKELRDIMDFLNSRKLYIPLCIQDYEKLNDNAKEIRKYIEIITDKIQDIEITYQILLNWLKNDCNVYDLKVLKEKFDNVELDKMKSIFSNRTGYINFIYGSKLKKFPVENIYGCRENIIIYAIRENKKSFLKLIEDNMEEFVSIPSNSILYHEKFYTKYININELTSKHLIKLKTMEYNTYSHIDKLNEQVFTFEEINTLYDMKKQYIELYNELLDLKVDDRILRIRQLSKKNLLDNITNDFEIKKIADKIKVKPLYFWLESDFNKIENIKIADVIQIFIHYDSIKKFLLEIKNRKELSYILRNMDKVIDYDSLKSIKDDIENIDEYWINLKNDLEFSDEFLQKYSNSIKEFLLNDGAELAYTYYINRNKEQKESFKLIIKAQLMGEFKKLKYHTDDLKQEINYELKDYQIKEWTENNSSIIDGKYNVREYDDFYHTMILGEYPRRTCLSYKSGGYNDCLLACFDSNKKILYAKINDKIVARAMVRLTKGTYSKERKNLKSLSFIDVETGLQTPNIESEENLTLFLERPYISEISDSESKKIKKLFIELLKTKARNMNALLVVSSNYNNVIDDQFITTRYYMYISKSKSSSQYLDSLAGEATITDEGQYKSNTFFIWKPIESEETIFDKSIFS